MSDGSNRWKKKRTESNSFCFPTTFAVLFSLTSVVLISGCGDGRPTRVPVSGRVTIDGEPLTHGFIRFIPTGSRMSVGQLDDQGRFQLSCFEGGDGAVLGEHRIVILSQEPLGQTQIKWHAPRKYTAASSSGLTEIIEGPTDSIEIELTWGNKKGPYVQHIR